MMKKIIPFLVLPLFLFAQQPTTNQSLLPAIQSFAQTSAVTGREETAAKYIAALFEKGICKKDKLGNVVITIGTGAPRRLFTAPLDEPGYVISQIQDDGYLRITPVGYGQQGNLFHQFLEGNEVQINTENSLQFGVSTVPSLHYDGLRAIPERGKNVFQWQESFIDVGESSAKGVAAKGIHLLDPLTLHKKPVVMADGMIAAPSATTKSAVIALAAVAQTLLHQKFKGTVVIAFTVFELINGKGLEAVVEANGPFDRVVRFNRFLNSGIGNTSEILVDKINAAINTSQKMVKPLVAFRHPSTIQPAWGNAEVYQVGLPANYYGTPVELVSANSVNELAQAWLRNVDNTEWMIRPIQPITFKETAAGFKNFLQEEKQVAALVAKYGVSTAEQPVREHILSQLPKWAKPVTDAKGNIIVRFGKGKQHIAFVGHMDEVGFLVDSIRENGTLVLKEMGGFFNWVWEAHSALVHTGTKEIPAIFEPRNNYGQATKRSNGNIALTVNAGFTSKQAAEAAGIKEGISSVTMPKKMIRLSEFIATARGFDDRAGCAALLMAINNIEPEQLPFTVTFVWSVEEETGLTGSTFASNALKDIDFVYPIDTYVSSDAPMESKIFGDCPLGNGAVIRVLESVNFIGRSHLKFLQTLDATNHIKTQYGMTAGGTDGQGFLRYGIPSVPLSWPGRYSHSPIEVMDFRDLQSLTQLIKAIMLDKHKIY